MFSQYFLYFLLLILFFFFFFNDTATTEIYTLSLHDALPIFPQRHHRAHGQRAGSERRIPWAHAYFAELRDVPVRLRAGRPAWRRPGCPVVARVPAVLLALVAARDAVPLEHEVPTGMGSALRVLRGRPAGSPRRRRLRPRRGVPRIPVQPTQDAHRASPGRPTQAGGVRAAA